MDKSYDVSGEMKRVLMCEPHLMSFVHLLKHYYADEAREGRGVIACTDGKAVWYGKEYTEMKAAERAYVFMHELSHGIYMHPDRAVLVRLLRGFLNPALFNYAGDAIINEAIDKNPVMSDGLFMAPEKFPPVRMAFIHKAMQEAIAFTKATPPSNYDPKADRGLQVETIYGWLVWALDATQQKRREMEKDCERAKQKQQEGKKPGGDQKQDASGGKPDKAAKQDPGNQGDQPGESDQPGKGNQPGTGKQPGASSNDNGACDPSGSPSRKPCTCGRCDQEGNGQGQGGAPGGGEAQGQGGAGDGSTMIERMARERAWDLEEQLDHIKKMLDEGRTTNEMIDDINDRITTARQRINQVVQGLKQQGFGKGSILLEMEDDLPDAVVPWDRKLRRLTTRNLGTKLDDSYTRYGSPTMTSLARGSRQVPFSPGTTIFTQRPKVLVILDVSGSHVGLLPQCFAEIDSIARKKGAEVEVMTFDDGVQEVIRITNRRDFQKLLARGLRGGGGTSLTGVWKAVSKMRDPYRMAVVMTDGYLHAGDPPKIPVIWMVTPGGTTQFVDWGEMIYLPEYMEREAA